MGGKSLVACTLLFDRLFSTLPTRYIPTPITDFTLNSCDHMAATVPVIYAPCVDDHTTKDIRPRDVYTRERLGNFFQP